MKTCGGVADGLVAVAVAVDGTGVTVAVGGTGVAVAVGGTGVAVAVGGTGVSVAVGGTGVSVAVGGIDVGVAVGSARAPLHAASNSTTNVRPNAPWYSLLLLISPLLSSVSRTWRFPERRGARNRTAAPVRTTVLQPQCAMVTWLNDDEQARRVGPVRTAR